jgi:hypothetical protein
MSAVATTDQPILLSNHVFEQDIPPTIADGIAALLDMDRQIIVVVGKSDGRMSGFLADLTHCITRRGSLLRIKVPLSVAEFHRALAAQLRLAPGEESGVQLASQVGHRLQDTAPSGRYVLLCEKADQYPLPTLEAIRQISNYPVSIVLVGGRGLTRRLRRASLLPLRQRVTHQLALNRFGDARWLWGMLAALLFAAGAAWYLRSARSLPGEAVPPPIPVKPSLPAEPPAHPITPASATLPPTLSVPMEGMTDALAAAAEPGPPEPELQLNLEHELAVRR